jgi:hypothetical protein
VESFLWDLGMQLHAVSSMQWFFSKGAHSRNCCN